MAIDYEAIFGQDEYDPCEALRALRPAYIRISAGESEQKITFEMKALVAQLESECRAKNGQPKRRFAITAGARYTNG